MVEDERVQRKDERGACVMGGDPPIAVSCKKIYMEMKERNTLLPSPITAH